MKNLKKILLRPIPIYSLLLLTFLSGCTLPSDGWFQRVEQNLSECREASQKNQENTRLLAKNTGNEKLISEWEKRVAKIPAPKNSPLDNNTGNWVETLLYLLLGMSGLSGMAKGANFLYKLPPKTGS